MPGDELQLGEVPADLVDEADVLRRERHPRTGHARAHADRDVELDALRVDRIELRVVDRRPAGTGPAGNAVAAFTPSSSTARLQVADRVHAAVRVDLEAPEEAVGVLLQRPQRVAAAVLGERHAEHALLDAELVHLLEQEPDRVVAGLGVRHVLEHVLRRELELVERLAGRAGSGAGTGRSARPARKGVAIIRSITPMSVGMVMRASLEREARTVARALRERSDPYAGVRERRRRLASDRRRARENGSPMNLKTAALRLGVHYQTAYRWVRSGQLVAVKVGAGYEISDAAVARLQAQRARDRADAGAAPSRSAPAVDAASSIDDALHVLDLDGRRGHARRDRGRRARRRASSAEISATPRSCTA